MARLPLWQTDWEQAEREWKQQADEAAKRNPLRTLKVLPHMQGITDETAKGLKWKSLKWMVQKDHNHEIFRGFFTHPLRYGWAFLKSAIRSKPYIREGDFFLYGIQSLKGFEKILHEQNSLLVVGFSYCHKPFECPSGRFTPDCMRDLENTVCQQCFIGKAGQSINMDRTILLIIPTIHYIGGKIFEIVHDNPSKKVIFMITACEMTLEMFGDWGNMVNLQGVGIRLDGRICNTMKAFVLSEQGIKPGLTVVLDDTQKIIMHLIRSRNQAIVK